MAKTRRAQRAATIERKTKETHVTLTLALDGTGKARVSTTIRFFDHMLELLAAHGLFDLALKAGGDTTVDDHHLVEDVGIVLGKALAEALGDKRGIVRYGSATVPMDEALATCAIDISGRPLCSFEAALPTASIAGFDTELAEEFFRAVANNAKLTLHLRASSGSNAHHTIEACFKAFARALRGAIARDDSESGVPSTKGVL